MPLAYQLEKLDGLTDEVKALYTEQDGKFVLAVEGLPKPANEDVSGLKKKVDELLAEKKAEKERREAAEAEARRAAEEAARKNGDTAALEKSWQEKLEKQEKTAREQIEKLTGTVTQMTSGAAATAIAAEIAVQGSANVLLPHIQGRLRTEYHDGEAKVVVLDKQGKPSALTVAELKQEFVDDPAFAPLIVGSKASGGGASGGKGNGGAGAKTITRPEFDAMDHAQRAEFAKTGGQVVDPN